MEGGGALPYIKFKNNQARKRWWHGEDGVSLITSWRRNGIAMDEIAKRIGVSPTTLDRWRQESDEMDRALTITEDLVDGMVEGALLKRALGYDYFEETWTRDKDTGRDVLTKKVKKHVPADVKAMAIWLYNRRSGAWRTIQQPLPPDDTDIVDVRNVLVQIEEVAGGGGASDAEAGGVREGGAS